MFCCCFGTCLSSISGSHLVALYLECCYWDLFEFHFWISFGRQVFEVLLVDPFWVPFLNLIWSPCIVWLSSCNWFRLTTVLREFGCFHVTRIEMWVTGLFSCMTWRMFRFSWRWWRRSSCVCRRNDDTCVGFLYSVWRFGAGGACFVSRRCVFMFNPRGFSSFFLCRVVQSTLLLFHPFIV